MKHKIINSANNNKQFTHKSTISVKNNRPDIFYRLKSKYIFRLNYHFLGQKQQFDYRNNNQLSDQSLVSTQLVGQGHNKDNLINVQ